MGTAAPVDQQPDNTAPSESPLPCSGDWLEGRVAAARRRGLSSVLWVESASPSRGARRTRQPGLTATVEPPAVRPLAVGDLPAPPARFDVVALSHVLTAVQSIEEILDRVAAVLDDRGLLLVEELCWERLDPQTGRWFFGFQDAIARERRGRVSRRSLTDRLNDWRAEHAGLRTGEACVELLERRFRPEAIEYAPQLGQLLDWNEASEYERLAIEAGVIQATGLCFVGKPDGRPPSPIHLLHERPPE